jgi:hypothetical protein
MGGRFPATVRPIPERFPTLHFNGVIRAGWRGVVSLTAEQARTLARDKALRKVPVIWLVARQSAIFDPNNDLPNALAKVRNQGVAERWGYISVRPYYLR